MKSKKELLEELTTKQRKNTPFTVLLKFKDLNRIVNNIDKSIFDNDCTMWKGFIHSYKNNYYINFFYKGSKKNLSRLLYYNFVGNIEETEYIKNICKNGGKCCNINHYKKFKKDVSDEDVNDNHDVIDNEHKIEQNNINNINNKNNKNNKPIQNTRNNTTIPISATPEINNKNRNITNIDNSNISSSVISNNQDYDNINRNNIIIYNNIGNDVSYDNKLNSYVSPYAVSYSEFYYDHNKDFYEEIYNNKDWLYNPWNTSKNFV